MTGGEIRVAAGIPGDFKMQETGFLDTFKEFELPNPEAIFDLEYFQKKPEVFYKFANHFYDWTKFKATYVHHFCKMLQDNGLVKYYLTQNTDNLEEHAGFT